MSSFKCGRDVEHQFGTDDATPRYSGIGKTQDNWLSDYNDQITWAEVKQISEEARATLDLFKSIKEHYHISDENFVTSFIMLLAFNSNAFEWSGMNNDQAQCIANSLRPKYVN